MADELAVVNARRTPYDYLGKGPLPGERRYVGRCGTCGKTHKLEGEILTAHAAGQHDVVVRDRHGLLWLVSLNGTDFRAVRVPCGQHWCVLRLVTEGSKRSKHECGARCTNATGPSCDCRCKGANHGMNC